MKCKYCDKYINNTEVRPQKDGFCSWDCFHANKHYKMLIKAGYTFDKYVEPRYLPLFEKQELFCSLFVELHSEVKAYRQAFPDECGRVDNDYDKVRAKARFLLRYPFIKRRVNELLEEQLSIISNNRVLVVEGFLNIATANIRDFLNFDGSIKSPEDWNDNMGKACKKYVRKFDKDGNLKEESVELYDKLNALSGLAKIEKLYKDTLDVNVKHTISSTIKTFGDDDMVAKLLENELDEAKAIAYDEKEVIEADVEDSKENE